MTKKLLCLMLAVLLLASAAPAAFAASAPWADDAVVALNAAYGNGTFTADDVTVKVSDAKGLVKNTFNYKDANTDINGIEKSAIFTTADASPLTRKEACAMIYAILKLPNRGATAFSDCAGLSSLYKEAIGTLQAMGVVNGVAPDVFEPEDTINNATLAVLFYRALRASGGLTFPLTAFKPGQYGAWEAEYLALRQCIPLDADGTFFTTGFGNTIDTVTGKEDIWNMWCNRLDDCVSQNSLPNSSATITMTYNAADNDFLTAIIEIVNADRTRLTNDANKGLFSDVAPGDWFYDGIMYLLYNDIVNGTGTGVFKPYDDYERGQFAIVLVQRAIGVDLSLYTPTQGLTDLGSWWGNEDAKKAVDWAVANGYMLAPGGLFRPTDKVTRQEMALVAFKMYNSGGYDGYAESEVNAAVLDRFSDTANIPSEYKTAFAYLVSVGAMNGTSPTTLDPTGEVNRAVFGAFFARVLQGLDSSKWKDYSDAVNYALTH